MSYINGIGNGQEVGGTVAATESQNVARVARADSTVQGSGSSPVQDASAGGAPVDVTELSSASGAITQALQGSDVRGDKVAALQQAIAMGTYNIPAADVADKLVNAMLK